MPQRSGKTIVRQWREEDIPAIVECQQAAYCGFPKCDLCDERNYRLQFEAFPDGQVLAEQDGRIIGYATSLIVLLEEDTPWYSYNEITGTGTFSTHDPGGDTLYGADIAVHPDFRGQGVAQLLYKARKKILKRFNLRRMVAGGRIPGYKDYAGKFTAEEYVEKVKRGDLKDPALSVHLRAGYEVRGVHMEYLSDAASLNYATFLEMPNPDYRPERRRIAGSPIRKPVRRIRVCSVQYEMRRVRSWEDFEQQVDFFVTTADEYHCHFLLFPELFTAQLFSLLDPELETVAAVEELAGYTGRYLEMFKSMARRSKLHIIGGSHPVHVDGELRNVAHLFTPNGNAYTQEKLHITPGERIHWGIQPGYGLRVFDTGLARIAIQVCYDIEFPETSRLLTLGGAEVIFVPFSTDERKAFWRIKACAAARAVENWIYTVISGSVGNLPGVKTFLINYGQSAVFTPSDFAFPPEATAAIADPNAETVVITELDLGSLSLQREMGSVTPLRDRRPDLYTLYSHDRVQVVRTD